MRNSKLFLALEKTRQLLESSDKYQWGHMGACNCGHLAQAISGFHRGDIHRMAQEKEGDWRDKTKSYCESSGLAIDDLIQQMLSFGFQLEDIEHFERLSDPKVLQQIPEEVGPLRHNQKNDVIIYLKYWSRYLESLEKDKVIA